MGAKLSRHRPASYSEVTPAATVCRIWGLARGAAVNRKFSLTIDGKKIAVELFRRANKALTVTGYTLDPGVREFANIDKAVDWGVVWGERRQAAAAEAVPVDGNGFAGNGSGCGYRVEQIERFVREGAPAGENRSDLFHTIVGHYLGCGWGEEQIFEHSGRSRVGSAASIWTKVVSPARSVAVPASLRLPSCRCLARDKGWTSSWDAKVPQPEPAERPERSGHDPELDDDDLDKRSKPDEDLELDDDPELDDQLDEPSAQTSNLPPLYAHGDPDPRPIKSWLVKHLIPTCGHGLLSGQWGAGKTFLVFDLSAAIGIGQPFLGHIVKRQCGVLLIAAEGGNEVRLRLDAVDPR